MTGGPSRLVRLGAQVVVYSIAIGAVVWLIGWLHMRGEDGGVADVGLAFAYGGVVLGLSAFAVLGLLLMIGGAVSGSRARRGRTSGQ
ncbi:MAG: hypothetical protein ACT4QG_12065 [Sporichthyaceae bacterium]